MPSPIIVQKLDSVARCIERIEAKRPGSIEVLRGNADIQDILMLNLERLVQLCVDIAGILITEKGLKPVPATMAEAFVVLAQNGLIDNALRDRLVKAVGFRNIAVHEYDKINWEIVFKIVTRHIDEFKAFARLLEKL